MILVAKTLLVDQGFDNELKIIPQGQKIIEMFLNNSDIIFQNTFFTSVLNWENFLKF